MAKYLPKSQISFFTAQLNDNFVFTQSGNSYVGPYIQLSNGNTYTGTSLSSMGLMIMKKAAPSYGADFETNNNRNSQVYNILESETRTYLDGVETPNNTKVKPTKESYEKGYYSRYFIKRANSQFDYKEISFDMYSSLVRKEGIYDHNLYVPGSIRWAVTGNVHKINSLNLKLLQKEFHFINNLFPLLNEFQKPNLVVQTNLTTGGNELYYANGNEYVGEYHIHPTQGPMEGATHTENEHSKLYYISDLPKIDGSEWENFLATQIQTPGNGCQQDISCIPGYHWVGTPICGCTPLESQFVESEHHSNEGETQGRSSTTTTTRHYSNEREIQRESSNTTPNTTPDTTGPSSTSTGGGGY